MLGLFMSTALGQAAQAAQVDRPGWSEMVVPALCIFAVVYFFMILPQKKKMKDQQSLLGSLKRGDQVITNGGILGEITNMTEKIVTLQVADNVRIKVVRSQILGLAKEGAL